VDEGSPDDETAARSRPLAVGYNVEHTPTPRQVSSAERVKKVLLHRGSGAKNTPSINVLRRQVSTSVELGWRGSPYAGQITTRSKSLAIRLFGNAFAASAKISSSG
jgi:hypothetical protein